MCVVDLRILRFFLSISAMSKQRLPPPSLLILMLETAILSTLRRIRMGRFTGTGRSAIGHLNLAAMASDSPLTA